MYGRKSCDVAGWTFEGDIYCDDHKPDDDAVVVFVDQVESDDRCGVCGEEL